MSATTRAPPPVRFGLGPWQVDASLDELRGPGTVHKLEPRAMRLLQALAQAGGEVVAADALLDAVWPGLVVTPSSLYDAVTQLRRALGPGHVLNVARKGYRLATPVSLGVEAHSRLGPRSIAVLPFHTSALPAALAFLRESVTGALIAELSRLPALTVVARGTMLTFGDHPSPPREVAAQLGARFVVDGRLDGRGESLHVSVQVADGWHDTQSWADELVLPLAAWHDTSGLVIGRLARALNFELNDLSARAPGDAGDAELQARALAAQSWVQLFARPQTPETNLQAGALATRALALAPRLAQAWMCSAYCDWRAAQFDWGDEPSAPRMARALSSIERAVELDPRDPDGHYVLGLITLFHGQLLRAEEALLQCLRLSSSFAPAHGLLGAVRERRGFPAETGAHCARAFALSPREPLRAVWHSSVALAALALDDPGTAFEQAQRGMAVNPGFPLLSVVGAAAAQRMGARAQAADCLRVLRERTTMTSLARVRHKLEITYELGHRAPFERMLDLLREAGLPER